MNDELPAHSAPPKPGLDHTDHGGIPAFCDRRKADDAADEHRASRERTIAALDVHLGRIAVYEHAMSRLPPEGGAALRTIVRRSAALPAPDDVGPGIREFLPTPAEWDRHTALAERIRTDPDSPAAGAFVVRLDETAPDDIQ